MKRNYKIIALISIVLTLVFVGFTTLKEKENPEKDRVLLDLLNFVLERGHYNPKAINDDFSKQVFDAYIENLDPTKRFFTQEDIDVFKKFELELDDMFKAKDLAFFDLTYSRLQQRMSEYKAAYPEFLDKPFDFKTDETISFDYENLPYAANKTELKKRWEQQLKYSVMTTIADKMKLSNDTIFNETEQENLKETENNTKKNFEELEEEARKSTLKSSNDYWDFVDDLERKDWFTVYINAIVERFDPHTFYFAPDDKEKFDESMSGKFEGIGARLQKKTDAIEVSELISGGPAWRGKELEQGDIILKVGQGKEEPIDIAGMRIDDVVKKIKGKKGTEVRLTIKKVDGSIKVISIIRDEVEMEETFTKSSTVEKDGKLYGIIYLPKFYISFDNKDNRDAFKDVAKEIDRLKAQNVQGIIMDLRDNGGGSLKTVVDMTGLFINEGPVVQVKYPGTKKEVLFDTDPQVQWEGPLVVLVNEFSASASEIFAAAIQDYKRGIVMGSKQTHGKGTVQNVVDLNQFMRNSDLGDLGALKLTIQKYYRIDGGSTQIEGVKSDIVLPDQYSYIEMGEKDLDNAMPWDKIEASNYKKLNSNFTKIIENSKKRIEAKEQFKLINENALWIKERKNDKISSLNFEKFKAKIETLNQETKKYRVLKKYSNNMKFNSLPYEMDLFVKDTVLKQKRERWHEDMTKDVYIEESLNVLNDLTGMQTKTKVADFNKKQKKRVN